MDVCGNVEDVLGCAVVFGVADCAREIDTVEFVEQLLEIEGPADGVDVMIGIETETVHVDGASTDVSEEVDGMSGLTIVRGLAVDVVIVELIVLVAELLVL